MSAAQPEVAPPALPALPAAPARLRRLLSCLPLALVFVAGVFVFQPGIRAPLALDDYFQISMIEGKYPAPRSPFDLYNFVGDADRTLLLDRGLIPWWSHPKLTVRFFRPLSSVLLYADRRIFGHHVLLSHLHSLAWWVAAVLAARSLYRRVLPRRPAYIALLIFALASCHSLPILWLAHREALVSLTFGLLALGALARARDQPGLVHVAAATGFFSLCLAGGEYGLGFGGYALALAVMGKKRPLHGRVLSLLSFAIPAAIYLGVRIKLGYGTEGSGLYHDPFREPVAYLGRVPLYLITLLGEGWYTLDADFFTSPTWVLVLVAVLGVLLLVIPLRRALDALGAAREHPEWLLAGSLLCLIPVLSVAPSTRVLGVSTIGIAAVVAVILDRAWFPPVPEARAGASELSGLVALGLGFAHFVHEPVSSWRLCNAFRHEAVAARAHLDQLRARVKDPATTEIVLARGMTTNAWILPYALDDSGTPPAKWWVLALTGHVLIVRRDARTIEVVANRDRGLFPVGAADFFRNDEMPLKVGEVIKRKAVKTTVLEVNDEGVRRARFEYDGPLESPSRVWIADAWRGIEDATPPLAGFGKSFEP